VAASVTAKSLPDMLSVFAAVSDAASAAQNRASTTASAGAASSDSIFTPPSTGRQERRARASLLRRMSLLGSVFPLPGTLSLGSGPTCWRWCSRGPDPLFDQGGQTGSEQNYYSSSSARNGSNLAKERNNALSDPAPHLISRSRILRPPRLNRALSWGQIQEGRRRVHLLR
jgi:hypothetical protein